MTSRDFCYWLQGYFELGDAPTDTLNAKQVDTIRRHLALVFKHEIDPSAGPPEHQAVLDAIHSPDGTPVSNPTSTSTRPRPPIGGVDPMTGLVLRC